MYVLVVAIVAATMLQQPQPAAASAPVLRGATVKQQPAECRLKIQGAQHGGILSASLECSTPGKQQRGGAVSLEVHEQLLGKFKGGFRGVAWPQGSSKRHDCLLTMVGATHATFVDSNVQGVRGDLVPGLKHILCVTGRSRVHFLESLIFSNNGTGLAVFDRAHVTLNASMLEGNTAKASTAGMLVSGSASAHITQNSSVLENVASIPLPLRLPLGTANGSQLAATGGVSVESNASLLVDGGSVIATNQGMAGNDTNNVLVAGGIYGRGHAKITVTDSTIANNVVNTTKGGAGVLVVDSARLLITGGTAISGNGPATPNGAVGAVVARDNSVVNITGGAVFVANKPKRSALMSNETDIVDMLDFNQFFAARDIVIYPNAALHLDESVQGVNGTGHSVTLDVCGKSVGWIRIPLINECPAGAYPVSMLFCECCLASTYFDGNMTARNCHPCPEGARCRGRWVTPLPGFWHSSPQSGNVHRCLNIAACTGKNCAAGYAGTLCASCAQGWGMTLPFRCVQCNPRWRQLGLYALFSFTTFLFILCTVHFTLRDNRHGGTHVRLSDLIKVVVNFLQYMVILGSVSAPWPDALRQAFVACSVVFGAATGQALSADCWLSHLHLPQPPLAIKRQLLNFLAPVFLACCVAATLAVLCALSGVLQLRRGRTRAAANSGVMRPFTRMLPTIGIIVIFYAYPTLIKASLGFFACFRVDDAIRSHPQGYWVYDMSQRCMDGWHKQWAFGLGLPATIVLCVGVPVGLVWLLLANKGRLDDQAFREKFGFLYRNYTQSKVWWEAVWASQTVLLTAIAVFHYNIKAYHSIVLLSLMFVGSALLQAIAKPYTDLQLHRLHLAASSCLFLTAQCSLTLFNLPGSAMPSDAVAAVEAFMIIINSAFLLWCGVAILMTMAGPAGGAWKWLVGLISARVMCGKAP